MLDQPFYRKLSIKPILERLNSPDLDPEIRIKATTQMGVSGPETLLVGLRKTLRFDMKEEAVLDGRKVWKFHGIWKNRQGLIVRVAGRSIRWARCRRTFRWTPRLYLGVEDGWPYQLILEGRASSRPVQTLAGRARTGRPIGSKASSEKIPRSTITMTYSNVKLNAQHPPRRIRVSAAGKRQRCRRHRIAR